MRFSPCFLGLVFALGATGLACQPSKETHSEATPEPCVSCHLPEYLSVRHPPHANARPTTCAVCHTNDAWSPSVLRHAWPLTGAHARTDCFACHRGRPPVFQGTSAACVDCHLADYDRSTFPGHSSFPTRCAGCHATTAFRPSTWALPSETSAAVQPASLAESPAAPHRWPGGASSSPAPAHVRPVATQPMAQPSDRVHPADRFPIASGHHARIPCRTCHSRGGTMGRDNTDCLQCHPREGYDGLHRRVDGYPQGGAPANFCVLCHKRGTRARY